LGMLIVPTSSMLERLKCLEECLACMSHSSASCHY
jgi:hypothetical protein